MSKKKGNKFYEVYNDFLVYASKRHKKQGFDALQRILKKIFQSIITRLIA